MLRATKFFPLPVSLPPVITRTARRGPTFTRWGGCKRSNCRRRYASLPLGVIHTLGGGVRRNLRRGLVVSALVLLGLLSIPAAGLSQPPVRSDDTARVRVDRFVVTGVSVFPEDQIQALLASGKGQELTLAEIDGLAARITALYRERGYILARAHVPAQDVRDGTVEIAVVEGRVGKVDIRGLRHYNADFVRRYVEPSPPGRVFESAAFERGLLNLNDLPGLAVKSTLRPGEEPGTTDIVLDADKDRLFSGAIDSNNYGSPETGYERFGVSLNLNNPLGLGDVLAFRGLTSTIGGALWLVRLSYAVPVNTLGTKVGAAYTHSHVGVDVGAVVGDITVRGDADIGSLFVLHPFIRSRELSVYGQAGFDIKNFDNNFQSQPQSQPQHDNLRVFSVGSYVDFVDRLRGANTGALTLWQGIGNFLGGMDGINDPTASVPGAGGTFTKLTGEVSRSQQIHHLHVHIPQSGRAVGEHEPGHSRAVHRGRAGHRAGLSGRPVLG